MKGVGTRSKYNVTGRLKPAKPKEYNSKYRKINAINSNTTKQQEEVYNDKNRTTPKVPTNGNNGGGRGGGNV